MCPKMNATRDLLDKKELVWKALTQFSEALKNNGAYPFERTLVSLSLSLSYCPEN